MLGFDAHRFGRAVSDLWLLEDICDKAAEQTLEEDQIADTKIQVLDGLKKVKALCVDAGLANRIGPQIARCEAEIDTETFQQIASRIDHLREGVLDELAEKPYFAVPQADSHFYGQAEPFGTDVATTFTVSADEFQQAAKCLSLQQPTACVFHLMRGMESAVKQLAGVLGMTVDSSTTWRQITGSMDPKIKLMPHQTVVEQEKKNSWESARINLHHLGSVLRNNTMHPTSSYSQEEARNIFAASGVVMRTLCKL